MCHHAHKVLSESFVVVQRRMDQHDGFHGLLVRVLGQETLQLVTEMLEGLDVQSTFVIVLLQPCFAFFECIVP